jgi:hypothetical protein
MAKMTIEFDTEAKSFTANVDGVAVANAIGAEIYATWDDEEKYRCNIIARTKDDKSGITEIRQLMASVTGQAKSAVKAGTATQSTIPGFVETREVISRVEQEIASAFGCAG